MTSGSERLAELLRTQADDCAQLGSDLYAHLLARAAEDLEAGGPVATVLAGHEDDPGGSVPPLRLMGAVHRLVLGGEAPALAAHYPSVGGDGDAEAAWPLVRELLGTARDELARSAHRPATAPDRDRRRLHRRRSASRSRNAGHAASASPSPPTDG